MINTESRLHATTCGAIRVAQEPWSSAVPPGGVSRTWRVGRQRIPRRLKRTDCGAPSLLDEVSTGPRPTESAESRRAAAHQDGLHTPRSQMHERLDVRVGPAGSRVDSAAISRRIVRRTRRTPATTRWCGSGTSCVARDRMSTAASITNQTHRPSTGEKSRQQLGLIRRRWSSDPHQRRRNRSAPQFPHDTTTPEPPDALTAVRVPPKRYAFQDHRRH